jgi:hypothetical protein
MRASLRQSHADNSDAGKINSSTPPSVVSSIIRTGTGPRSPQGKKISSRNSLRHGIFAKAAVLKWESQTEFNSLLSGLRKDFRPVGALEESLVEKLTVTLWRERRLLIAEGAEIQTAREALKCDQQEQLQIEVRAAWANPRGMIRQIGNTGTGTLKACIDLLTALKVKIVEDGFDPEVDKKILAELYGGNLGRDDCQNDLVRTYETVSAVSDTSRIDQSKSNFLKELNNEIEMLVRHQKEQRLAESNQMELESLRRSVPESPRLDQFLRYSASLERSFDRTLSQLERAQRMRRGQPVAPRIDVNVSSS